MLQSNREDNSVSNSPDPWARRSHLHHQTELRHLSSLAFHFIPPKNSRPRWRKDTKSITSLEREMNNMNNVMRRELDLQTEEDRQANEKLESFPCRAGIPLKTFIPRISPEVSSVRQPFDFERSAMLQDDREMIHELYKLKLLQPSISSFPFGLSPQIPNAQPLSQRNNQQEVFHNAMQSKRSSFLFEGQQTSCFNPGQDTTHTRKLHQAAPFRSSYVVEYPDIADISDKNDPFPSFYKMNFVSLLQQQQQPSSMLRQKHLPWALSPRPLVTNRDVMFERMLSNHADNVNHALTSEINLLAREQSKPTEMYSGHEDDLLISDPFPVKLHRLLRDLEMAEMTSIACFLPSGLSFTISNPFRFENHIMRRYFPRMSTFASFQRQLNLYDFHRRSLGPEKGAYFHPKFKRDCPFRSLTMKRIKIRGTRKRRKKIPCVK